jgi:hypothetical protein
MPLNASAASVNLNSWRIGYSLFQVLLSEFAKAYCRHMILNQTFKLMVPVQYPYKGSASRNLT